MATDEDIGKLFHELDVEDRGYITLDEMVIVRTPGDHVAGSGVRGERLVRSVLAPCVCF